LRFAPKVAARALIKRCPIEGSCAYDGTKPQRIGLTTLRSSVRMITGTSCEGAIVIARREERKIALKIPADLDFTELE
jgi:hypothetical protein